MANSIKHPRMARVICNAQPLGDILTRQPKSPGQKAVTVFSVPPMLRADGKFREGNLEHTIKNNFAYVEGKIVWANETNLGHRCTNCGQQGHPFA